MQFRTPPCFSTSYWCCNPPCHPLQAPLLVCRIWNETTATVSLKDAGGFFSSIYRCADLCLQVGGQILGSIPGYWGTWFVVSVLILFVQMCASGCMCVCRTMPCTAAPLPACKPQRVPGPRLLRFCRCCCWCCSLGTAPKPTRLPLLLPPLLLLLLLLQEGAQVFSFSLGYTQDVAMPDPGTLEMVSAIRAAGGLVVAAAGNGEAALQGDCYRRVLRGVT
jgi:hypothetical protein